MAQDARPVLEIDGVEALILREPKPVAEQKVRHQCVVVHGEYTRTNRLGAIIQCSCGRRYRCRASFAIVDVYVWVRRILPWPPKQEWTQ